MGCGVALDRVKKTAETLRGCVPAVRAWASRRRFENRLNSGFTVSLKKRMTALL